MNIEDVLYPFLKYYERAPRFIRNFSGNIYRAIPLKLRYGKLYNDYKNLISKTQYYSDKEKGEFIIENLKKTFINAYENTIYYKKIFDEYRFNPYTFDNLKKLEIIPFSDKSIIRENKESLINFNIPKEKLFYTTTGGTSGIPVEVFYVKGRERSREFVFMTNQWERIGYKFSDRIAVIRGGVVDHAGKNQFFKFEPIKNRLLLSNYDLYEENFPYYIKKLMEFRPHFIHTYPSAIILLSKYIIKENISFPDLKGLFCSSEQFYPGQREIIEKAFNARVYSWYGHTEGTTLAGECESSKNYHIFYEYGYTELIDENDNIITESGKQGEIVGTSFEMSAFPIIRYRTGDYAEYVGEKCSCGRNYTLITNVKGRWKQEQIITNKNSGISMTALNMHSKIFDNVIQYQFYQKEAGKVTLKIIKGKEFSIHDEGFIFKAFNEKFKNLVEFTIQYVDNIDRTEVGKHKFLIQDIKN